MFGTVGSVIGILLAGGKFAGLTLVQWEAVLAVIQAEEPLFEKLVSQVGTLEPKLYDALTKVGAAINSHPTTGIPGYGPDGGVTTVPTPHK